MDRAGRDYWERLWAAGESGGVVDPGDRRSLNHPNVEIHAFLSSALSSHNPSSGPVTSLLEIGCARSQWLPYFAREFGFAVTGLDYSETGCLQEREILARAGLSGEIVCADMFQPPSHMLARFDVLWTNGVLEHFDDTAATVRSFSSFLRPGGLMITLVPNMRGAVGLTQKILSPSTYRIHVPLSREEMCDAHVAAGLEVVRCEYVMSVNFGAVAVSRSERLYSLRMFILRVLRRLSLLAWMVERNFRRLPVWRNVSPYIICVATKPI